MNIDEKAIGGLVQEVAFDFATYRILCMSLFRLPARLGTLSDYAIATTDVRSLEIEALFPVSYMAKPSALRRCFIASMWTLPKGDADFSMRWSKIKRYVSQRCGEAYGVGELSISRVKRHESGL